MTQMTNPVELTDGAVAEIKKIMNGKGFDASRSLRIGVKGGGCSGMTYILDFEHKKENDFEFETEGIKCIMDKSHEMYLHGMKIDWQNPSLSFKEWSFENLYLGRRCLGLCPRRCADRGGP